MSEETNQLANLTQQAVDFQSKLNLLSQQVAILTEQNNILSKQIISSNKTSTT